MIADIKNFVDANGRLIDQQPSYENILNFKVALLLDERVVAGWVQHQVLVPKYKIVGRYDANPMMNSMIYGLESPNDQVKDYGENLIANNIHSKVYDK